MRRFIACGLLWLPLGLAAGATTPPAITTQPKDTAVVAPQGATFTVTATGSAPLTYAWLQSTDGGVTFAPIPTGAPFSGQATRSLRVNPSQEALSGRLFQCVVSNRAGQAASHAATLTVNLKPAITLQPTGLTIQSSAPASFTVAASGTGTLAYQWGKNGKNLPGATTPVLALSGEATNLSATYTCVVSNAFGMVTSKPAVLKVAQLPGMRAVPPHRTVVAPALATFSVVATGTGPFTYQWQWADSSEILWLNLSDGPGVKGATSPTMRIGPTTADQSGRVFRCIITNVVGSVRNVGAVLTVNVKPAITQQPAGASLIAGQPFTFSAEATGQPEPRLQWKRNGVALPGQTSPTLSLAAATVADAGTYTLTATNAAGSVTSKPVKLAVTPPAQGIYVGTYRGAGVGGIIALLVQPADNMQLLIMNSVSTHNLPVDMIANVAVGSDGAFSGVSQLSGRPFGGVANGVQAAGTVLDPSTGKSASFSAKPKPAQGIHLAKAGFYVGQVSFITGEEASLFGILAPDGSLYLCFLSQGTATSGILGKMNNLNQFIIRATVNDGTAVYHGFYDSQEQMLFGTVTYAFRGGGSVVGATFTAGLYIPLQ